MEFVEIDAEVEMFRAKGVVYGVKCRGVRGLAHKIAAKHGASSLSTGHPIRYGETDDTEDNLYLDVFFASFHDRVHFEGEISELHKMIPSLVAPRKDDVKVDLKGTIVRIKGSLLKTILARDFGIHLAYDDPVQSLESYAEDANANNKRERSTTSGGSSSGRVKGRKISPSSRKWQSLEEPDSFGPYIPYYCHLIPKGWKKWEENPNNFIPASWAFHQDLDGLNVEARVPNLVIEFVRDAKLHVDAEDGRRHKVDVRIRFRTKELAVLLTNRIRWKTGSVFVDDVIQSFVHVKDPVDYRTCVEIKRLLTENAWKKMGF